MRADGRSSCAIASTRRICHRGGGRSLAPASLDAEPAAASEFDEYTVEGMVPQGTTVNAFDYWVTERDAVDNPTVITGNALLNGGINANHDFKFTYGATGSQGQVNKWVGSGNLPLQGLVGNTLANGFPRLVESASHAVNNPESLAYLFNSDNHEGKASYTNVGGLLQIDEDGYYYYNSKENFTSFDEASNSFKLYELPGVNQGGGGVSGSGQFFPFDTADEVFTVQNDQLVAKSMDSKNATLNHWFGLNMSTRFMQANGGHTDETLGTPVTYEFSGDDDVWVFIDDVLVGDLGGIHDTATLKIDFSTGKVEVGVGTKSQNTTLKECFDAAGKTPNGGWADGGEIFKDNTIHTLKFFYLERGNYDSNMHLKFNLITVPESDIQKVDQAGKGIDGAEFQLFAANENYEITNETPLASGATADGGFLTLETVDADGSKVPLSFDELAQQGIIYYLLKETGVPEGYRSTGDMQLCYEEHDGSGIVLSSNYWETGAYAGAKFTASAPETLKVAKEGTYEPSGETLTDEQIQDGMLFAVILKREDNQWVPMSGDNINGWHAADDASYASVVEAAKANQVRFTRDNTSFGSAGWKATIERLPGDITKYYHFTKSEADSQYAVAYYYSSAKTFGELSDSNVKRIYEDPSDMFGAQYSVRLFIPDVRNTLYVQKVDELGNPVNGVEFALYDADSVEEAEDGTITIKEGAEPYDSATTADLTEPYVLEGGIAFGYLNSGKILKEGKYYLVETLAAEGYSLNETVTPVIVDGTGVYAYAGDEGVNDGITVLRGAGALLASMTQFGEDDSTDATLHDIKAQFQLGTKADDGAWSWEKSDTYLEQNAANIKDGLLHLQYMTDEGTILEYGPYGGEGEPGLTADYGWPRLQISQCYSHDGAQPNGYKENLGDKDITNLFSRTCRVIVRDYRVNDLQVTKTVEGQDAPADASFDFDVTLERGSAPEGTPLAGTYECEVTDAEGNPVAGAPTEIEFTAEGEGADATAKATFTLKHGQTITIKGIPVGVKYTVTEQQPENPAWTSTPEGNEGNIPEGDDPAKVTFTNTYTPKPVEYELTAKKTLVGVGGADAPELEEGQFTFILRGDKTGVPMPEGSTLNETLGVWEKTVQNGAVAAGGDFAPINFGKMKYEHAGEYRYVIVEQQVEEGQFATDPTRYEAVVTVSDTDGVLGVSGVKYRVINDSDPSQGTDAAEVAFENDFTPGSATEYFQVFKLIQNNADPSAKPDYDNGESPNSPNGFTVELKADHAEKTDAPGTPIEVEVPMPEGNAPFTATTAGYGVADLPEITYDADDLGNTYFYTIEEDSGNKPGITYDSVKVWAKVAVSQDAEGNIKLDISYRKGADGEWKPAIGEGEVPSFGAEGFTNIYNAKGTLALEVEKTLTGRDMSEGEFSFTLAADENNDASGYTMPSETTVSAPTADAGEAAKAAFDDITFAKAGTYTFTISENIPDGAEDGIKDGVTYDPATWMVKVEVTDNGDGTLKVAPTYTSSEGQTSSVAASFENAYNAKGTAKVGGTKTLTGRPWQDTDAFMFDLEATGDTAQAVEDGVVVMPDTTSVGVSGAPAAGGDSQAFSFEDITFTAVGEYTFKVTEQHDTQGDIPGVDYDETVYDVTVKVTDPNRDGKLACEVAYAVDGESAEGIVFINDYTSEGTAVISGNKVLTGRDWADDDSFTFTLEAADDATKQAIDGGDIELGATEDTVTSEDAPDYKFSFGEMTFKNVAADETKTYTFEVCEKAPDGAVEGVQDGVSYDFHVATVKVTVVGGTDGTADVSTSVTSEGSLTFENKYEPEPIDVPLSGTKELTGRDGGVKDGEFTFEIEKVSVDGATSGERFDAMPLSSPAEVANDAKGDFAFSALHFTQAGEYIYRVSEVKPEEGASGGVDYDTTKYLVTVSATDDGEGTLSHTVSYAVDGGGEADGLAFQNTYKADPVSGSIKGTKKMTGEEFALEAGMFSFTLEKQSFDGASDEVALAKMPIADPATVTNNADGSFAFDEMEFTQPGTYVYKVSELDDNPLPGVSYDGVPVTVTFVVKDNGEGALVIESQTYAKAGAAGDATEATFTNTYQPGEVFSTLSGTKKLIGATEDTEAPALEGGEFTFLLEPSEETAAAIKAGEVALSGEAPLTATNDANGAFTFGEKEITFKAMGDYTFTVSEQAGSDAHIDYARTVYTATAHVTDNGGESGEAGSGKLSVEWEITGGAGDGAIVFTNTYTPSPTQATIEGTKELVAGSDADSVTAPALEGGEFTFQLKEAQGNVIDTATNNADGAFAFAPIDYTEPGKHIYTVSEVRGNMGGVDYDDASYTVTVEVADNDGQLVVDVSYATASGDPAEGGAAFTNTYTPTPTEVTLGAVKTLSGRDLTDAEFTFQLKQGDTVLAEATNTAEGSVTFEPLTLDKPGEYTFAISEVAGAAEGVAYDTAVHTVVVTVIDDGEGALKATVEYDGGTAPVFRNTYTPPTTPPNPLDPSTDPDPDTLAVTGDGASMANMALGVAVLAAFVAGAVGLRVARRRS